MYTFLLWKKNPTKQQNWCSLLLCFRGKIGKECLQWKLLSTPGGSHFIPHHLMVTFEIQFLLQFWEFREYINKWGALKKVERNLHRDRCTQWKTEAHVEQIKISAYRVKCVHLLSLEKFVLQICSARFQFYMGTHLRWKKTLQKYEDSRTSMVCAQNLA